MAAEQRETIARRVIEDFLLLFFSVALAIALSGCASPRETAIQRAMRDYETASAESNDYARQQVSQLVDASRLFRAANGRWPSLLPELAQFAAVRNLKFDPFVFNSASFAVFADGSLQIHFDVNCSRFDTAQYTFKKQGSVNLKE